MSYEFPSPFQSPALDALSPDDYLRSFDDAFLRPDATLEAAGADPRVEALVTPPDANAARRHSAADSDDADAFAERARREGVGIAGAGLMGISIAAAFVNAEFPVLSYDTFEAARVSAPDRLAAELATLRRNAGDALPDPDAEASRVAELVERFYRATGELTELAARPVVVESTPEKPRLKAKLYKQLDAAAAAKLLLLTNTSSLTIGELAAALPDESAGRPTSAARFAGFHFFHPATKRRPVEIAIGASTSPETAARAKALGKAIHKLPMVVGDAPGFLVNRLLQAYLNEALAALDEGVDAQIIEDAMRRFGMEGAPLRVIDEIGADVALHSGWSFYKAFPERTHDSAILPALVRAERLGRKSQRGFYRYESRRSWADDATLDADRTVLAELAGPDVFAAAAGPVDPRFQTPDALALRAAVSIFFEACRLVDEGVAPTLREADAGLVLALGFPPAKGGICYWAFAFGLRKLLRAAKELEPLGKRFEAPGLALRLADAFGDD